MSGDGMRSSVAYQKQQLLDDVKGSAPKGKVQRSWSKWKPRRYRLLVLIFIMLLLPSAVFIGFFATRDHGRKKSQCASPEYGYRLRSADGGPATDIPVMKARVPVHDYLLCRAASPGTASPHACRTANPLLTAKNKTLLTVHEYRGEHTLIATTTGSSYGEMKDGQPDNAALETNDNPESKLYQNSSTFFDQQTLPMQQTVSSPYCGQSASAALGTNYNPESKLYQNIPTSANNLHARLNPALFSYYYSYHRRENQSDVIDPYEVKVSTKNLTEIDHPVFLEPSNDRCKGRLRVLRKDGSSADIKGPREATKFIVEKVPKLSELYPVTKEKTQPPVLQPFSNQPDSEAVPVLQPFSNQPDSLAPPEIQLSNNQPDYPPIAEQGVTIDPADQETSDEIPDFNFFDDLRKRSVSQEEPAHGGVVFRIFDKADRSKLLSKVQMMHDPYHGGSNGTVTYDITNYTSGCRAKFSVLYHEFFSDDGETFENATHHQTYVYHHINSTGSRLSVWQAMTPFDHPEDSMVLPLIGELPLDLPCVGNELLELQGRLKLALDSEASSSSWHKLLWTCDIQRSLRSSYNCVGNISDCYKSIKAGGWHWSTLLNTGQTCINAGKHCYGFIHDCM